MGSKLHCLIGKASRFLSKYEINLRQFATLNKRNIGLFIGDLSLSIYIVGHIQIEDPSLYCNIHATSNPLLFTLCYKIISLFTYGVMRINHGSDHCTKGSFVVLNTCYKRSFEFLKLLAYATMDTSLFTYAVQCPSFNGVSLLQGILYCLCVLQMIILCSLKVFYKGSMADHACIVQGIFSPGNWK